VLYDITGDDTTTDNMVLMGVQLTQDSNRETRLTREEIETELDFVARDDENAKRRCAIMREDPVYLVPLRDVLRDALREFERQVPKEVLLDLVKNMREDVAEVINKIAAGESW